MDDSFALSNGYGVGRRVHSAYALPVGRIHVIHIELILSR